MHNIVFGLLTLAEFTYVPQLANPPDQKMRRVDHATDYGAFQGRGPRPETWCGSSATGRTSCGSSAP